MSRFSRPPSADTVHAGSPRLKSCGGPSLSVASCDSATGACDSRPMRQLPETVLHSLPGPELRDIPFPLEARELSTEFLAAVRFPSTDNSASQTPEGAKDGRGTRGLSRAFGGVSPKIKTPFRPASPLCVPRQKSAVAAPLSRRSILSAEEDRAENPNRGGGPQRGGYFFPGLSLPQLAGPLCVGSVSNAPAPFSSPPAKTSEEASWTSSEFPQLNSRGPARSTESTASRKYLDPSDCGNSVGSSAVLIGLSRGSTVPPTTHSSDRFSASQAHIANNIFGGNTSDGIFVPRASCKPEDGQEKLDELLLILVLSDAAMLSNSLQLNTCSSCSEFRVAAPNFDRDFRKIEASRRISSRCRQGQLTDEVSHLSYRQPRNAHLSADGTGCGASKIHRATECNIGGERNISGPCLCESGGFPVPHGKYFSRVDGKFEAVLRRQEDALKKFFGEAETQHVFTRATQSEEVKSRDFFSSCSFVLATQRSLESADSSDFHLRNYEGLDKNPPKNFSRRILSPCLSVEAPEKFPEGGLAVGATEPMPSLHTEPEDRSIAALAPTPLKKNAEEPLSIIRGGATSPLRLPSEKNSHEVGLEKKDSTATCSSDDGRDGDALEASKCFTGSTSTRLLVRWF